MSTNDGDTQPRVEVKDILSGDPETSPNPPLNSQTWNFKVKSKSRFGLRTNHNTAKGSPTTDPYDYERKYEEDEYGEELAPNARVWRTYQDEAARFDSEMVETWRDMLDVLLVFAGLFSAIVTTFAGQASLSLQPDNTPLVTASLIQELISLQRAAGAGQNLSTVPPSSLTIDSPSPPSTSDVWVNGLWFTSLAFSLTAALLAVIVKQWIASYVSVVSGTPQEQARVRHFRTCSLERWHVPTIVGWLPLLLYIALFLFLIGLVIFLFKLNLIIACIVAAMGSISFIAYFGSHIVSVIFPDCPYRTTLSVQIDVLIRKFLRVVPWSYRLARYALYLARYYALYLARLAKYGAPSVIYTYVYPGPWSQWLFLARFWISKMRGDSSSQAAHLAQHELRRFNIHRYYMPIIRPPRPPEHAFPSLKPLKDREASLIETKGKQLDAEALLWLHASSSNATVRSVVVQSVVSISYDLDPKVLHGFAVYFLPLYLDVTNVVQFTRDSHSVMPTNSSIIQTFCGLLRSLRLLASLSVYEIEGIDMARAGRRRDDETSLFYGFYCSLRRQGLERTSIGNLQWHIVAFISRLSDDRMLEQHEEADWERFFEAATAEVMMCLKASRSSAMVEPVDIIRLWDRIFHLLRVLPHDKISIEAAQVMHPAETSRRTLTLIDQSPSVQLSRAIVRYIQAQGYGAATVTLNPEISIDHRDVQITSVGKRLTFLGLLRAAYNHVNTEHPGGKTDERISLIISYLRLLFASPHSVIGSIAHLEDDHGPFRVEIGGQLNPLYDHYRLFSREIERKYIVGSPVEHGLPTEQLALRLTYTLEDHDDRTFSFSDILADTSLPEPQSCYGTLHRNEITINRLMGVLCSLPVSMRLTDIDLYWSVDLLLADNVYTLLQEFYRRKPASDPREETPLFFNGRGFSSCLDSARLCRRELHLDRALMTLFDAMKEGKIPIDKINDDILLDLCRWYTIGREAEMGSLDIRIPAFKRPAILVAMALSADSHRETWHRILRKIDDVISQNSHDQKKFVNVKYDPDHPYAAGFKLLEEMKEEVGFVSAPQGAPQTSQTE